MTARYRISAYADELGPDVDLQFATLARLGIEEIQLRGAWGRNVMELTAAELKTVRSKAESLGLGLHAIGSPIGKSYLAEPAEASIEAVRVAAAAAHAVGVDRVRVFSFYRAEDETPEAVREEVLGRIGRMADTARAEGVTLILENESGLYGDVAARCRDLLDSVPDLGMCFDFANFVGAGERVPEVAWPLLRDRVTYFDVKDMVAADHMVKPAGEGDGGVRDIIHDALAHGFSDRFNLEPHLSMAGPRGGLTSPELFEVALGALRRILESAPRG